MDIILGSASDRRQELLQRLVKKFSIIIGDFDENSVVLDGDVSKFVEEIALGKAKSIIKKITKPSIIIAADTVVAFEGQVLGKPKDEMDAFNMLEKLSDNTHEVYTGIVLINTATNKILKDSLKTEVVFSKLEEKDIKEYIETGEPMDKAGAYGIQGNGGVFVKKINGCYYNVMGLPLNRLKVMLKEIS